MKAVLRTGARALARTRFNRRHTGTKPCSNQLKSSVTYFHRQLSATAYASPNSTTRRGLLTEKEILEAPSTPISCPSYPRGPYTFIDRQYFIIAYESDPEAIARVVPEPLKPQGNVVLFEWINMPDSTGFGSYQEAGTVIPCTFEGKEVNFTTQMFLDCEPPIAGGREIWGFPKKYANPQFGVNSDTICGKLTYANQLVAQGTMAYKYKEIPEKEAIKALGKTQVNLKLIPDVDWAPKVARLVSYNLTNIRFKGAWEGPARLHLIPHVNCPAAELPVRKVLGGKHFLADITLPYGSVMYDYLKEKKQGTLYKSTNPNALTPEKILNSTAMPVIAPSYAKGPLGLHDREYFILRYHTDEGVLQKFLPDKLFANKDNEVIVQWITTRGTGIGDYSKFEVLIPCTDERGNVYRFGVFSFLNSSAPITEGREVWGQPQKFAHPTVELEKDTINGSLEYSKMQVANGSMRYKQKPMDERAAIDFMTVPYLYLKLIPDVRGAPEIAQLVELNPNDVRIHSAWEGDAALNLIDHANAPVADLPVRKVIGGLNLVVDMTFASGSVRHDYLAGKPE